MAVPKVDEFNVTNYSIFKDILNDPLTEVISSNLLKKLYFRGIIPNYITRGDNRDEEEDSDYLALFYSVAKFFALIIRFSKRFENFNTDFELMKENVRQNNLFIDESNANLENLQYLSSHLYDEIRKRGTSLIFKGVGEPYGVSKVMPVDGEFRRLLNSKPNDELLNSKIPKTKMGWCVGNSSPMYRGVNGINSLNKTKENTKDFVDFNNYFISEVSYSNIITVDDRKVLLLSSNPGSCGIGRSLDSDDASDHLMKASSSIDYEITFSFKLINASADSKLIFGVEGFDNLKNKLVDAFITPNGDAITDLFFETPLTNFRNDVWYNVRGIIHCYSSENKDNYVNNLNIGNNLYFNNKFVKFIYPIIQMRSNDGGAVSIWNYKVRPLVLGTNILPLKGGDTNAKSDGFVQSYNLFYIYAKNNNKGKTNEQITYLANKYLLPYNLNNITIYI